MPTIENALKKIKSQKTHLPYYYRFAEITEHKQDMSQTIKLVISDFHSNHSYKAIPSNKPILIL